MFEYRHGDDGCSVTGGVVMRDGRYLIGDYCSSRYWAIDAAGDAQRLAIGVEQPVSFGFDRLGKVIVVSQGGSIYRLAI